MACCAVNSASFNRWAATTSAGARATNPSLPSLARMRGQLLVDVGDRLAVAGLLGLLVDQPVERQDDLGVAQDGRGELGGLGVVGGDRHRRQRWSASG